MGGATKCVFAPKCDAGELSRRAPRSRWCCVPPRSAPMPSTCRGSIAIALDNAQRYREITVPTVVISGDSDTVVYEEIHSTGLARDIPGAELVWVKNLGHKPDWIAPDLIVAAIEKVAGKPATCKPRRAPSRRGSRTTAGLWTPVSTKRSTAPNRRSFRLCRVRARRARPSPTIGDAQHIGGARRSQRHAGRDDDPVAVVRQNPRPGRSGRRGRPCRRGRWRPA